MLASTLVFAASAQAQSIHSRVTAEATGLRDQAMHDTYYFDHHHTPDDTLDKIDRDDLNQSVAAYATVAFIAANIRENFGRLAPYTRRKRTCSAEDDNWLS